MLDPVYQGMPSIAHRFRIEKEREQAKAWGVITAGGRCRDDYPNIRRHNEGGGLVVILQRAALESFLDAQHAVGGPITLTGSWRSCALQASLYRSDPSRFASPNTTAHTRGLAIDVAQNVSKTRLDKIDKALRWRRWYQARPVDEPWHYSFGLEV